MPMEIEGAIKIEAAVPDSHYRLLPCPECGSDNVAYVQYMTGIQEPWKVCCFDCGFTVDQQKIFRHEAQVAWNRECQEKQEKPCLNCQDRKPGCADHCRKGRFLKWKADKDQRLAAQHRQSALNSYTLGEIRKNRRIRK